MCLIFCLRSNGSQALERNTPLIQRLTSVRRKHTIRVLLPDGAYYISQAPERNTSLFQRLTSARKKHTADPTAHKRSKETHDPCASSWLGILPALMMVLDYLIKFKHISFWNFCQIQKILVNAFLIENGKMVNSLNSWKTENGFGLLI